MKEQLMEKVLNLIVEVQQITSENVSTDIIHQKMLITLLLIGKGMFI
jgi:hypothetical protein